MHRFFTFNGITMSPKLSKRLYFLAKAAIVTLVSAAVTTLIDRCFKSKEETSKPTINNTYNFYYLSDDRTKVELKPSMDSLSSLCRDYK